MALIGYASSPAFRSDSRIFSLITGGRKKLTSPRRILGSSRGANPLSFSKCSSRSAGSPIFDFWPLIRAFCFLNQVLALDVF